MREAAKGLTGAPVAGIPAEAIEVLSHDEAARVVGLSEGTTGGLLRGTDVEMVVYSEPVEPD